MHPDTNTADAADEGQIDADPQAGAAPVTPAAIPATMRAIVQDRYGSPDVLELREVPTPEPADDRVLIRVLASSLNIYDHHMTTGTPIMARAVAGIRVPKMPIPGADVAGVVVAVGGATSQWKVGDEVFGDIGAGAFAEYAVAKEKAIARKPAGVSFAEAAAVPLAALTALQGLRDVGGLKEGQKAVINGASGGVGTFAVQIAKALGAEVTAICSTHKVDTARSIGADHVVDYTVEDFTTTVRNADVLFDNVGIRPWSATSKVLRPGGVNVTITGPKHGITGPMREMLVRKAQSVFGNKRMASFTAHVDQADLDVLAGWLESGAVTPVVENTYSLDQLPAALAYLAEGHAHAKLVITT